MSRFRVLITDFAWPDVEIERRILAEADAELIVAESQDPSQLVEQAAGADAIMTCWAQTTEAVIAAAPACRIVARMGIGLDNIDVAYCTSRGIPVTNVPDYCVVEVAEHTLSLLFALARGIAHYVRSCQRGEYLPRRAPSLLRLEGTTLGLVGLGRIGGCVAAKAQALGLRVVANSRSGATDLAGVEMLSLNRVLATSDFVSLHLPLTAETKQLIGADAFEQMRPSAYLINTSRGRLVDHGALAVALANGKIAGAALDVQDPEPPPLDQPPFNDPRVLITPHAAFVSEHSVVDLRRRAAAQVAAMLRDEIPENVVNPAVLEGRCGGDASS